MIQINEKDIFEFIRKQQSFFRIQERSNAWEKLIRKEFDSQNHLISKFVKANDLQTKVNFEIKFIRSFSNIQFHFHLVDFLTNWRKFQITFCQCCDSFVWCFTYEKQSIRTNWFLMRNCRDVAYDIASDLSFFWIKNC